MLVAQALDIIGGNPHIQRVGRTAFNAALGVLLVFGFLLQLLAEFDIPITPAGLAIGGLLTFIYFVAVVQWMRTQHKTRDERYGKLFQERMAAQDRAQQALKRRRLPKL